MFAIPRIQYKNVDTTGNTTSGNATITNIPSTTLIEVGMFVRGTGIPSGSTVGSKTSTSITLFSGTCSLTNTGVTLAFGYEINFDYPPKEPRAEKIKPNFTESTSLSGVRQVSVDNIEAARNPVFSFVSESTKTLIDTFMQSHGLYGKPFRYYEDKTLSTYREYELDSLEYEPKKIAPKGIDVYIWEIPLKFVRTL